MKVLFTFFNKEIFFLRLFIFNHKATNKYQVELLIFFASIIICFIFVSSKAQRFDIYFNNDEYLKNQNMYGSSQWVFCTQPDTYMSYF